MARRSTNVIKNATEAIAAVPTEQTGESRRHRVIGARRDGDQIVVDVIDNGIGLAARRTANGCSSPT